MSSRKETPTTPTTGGRYPQPPPFARQTKASSQRMRSAGGRRPSLEVSNPGCILALCESLTESSSAVLQSKVNRFLEEETKAQLVFQIWLLTGTEEALVHVIGEKHLAKEMRFPVANRMLQPALNNISQTNMSTELDPELVTVLQYVIPSACEVLTVPVMHPNRREVCLLVCVLNYPADQQNRCQLIISETFRFCLAIIYNTTMCEEERRLKEQCQTLLTVAKKLFMHLGDLSDLLKEIILEARRLTNAERCSLFLIDPDDMNLVAKVFDGVAEEDEVRIAKSQGIAGHVATTGQLLNIRDAYKHPLFFKGMDETTGFRTRNILCFPISDDKTIIGVAQLCNKMDGLYFDGMDEEVAMAFRKAVDLLKEIILEARRLTNAERCSLFLIDPDDMNLVAKVFDGVAEEDEVRIAKSQGIAGHVATTGQLLNIRDAYKHPLFFKGMDETTGFRTRNILCFPISDDKTIIGVAQLCNKMDGLYFDGMDEEVAMAFSVYCGISMMHSLVYKKIQDAQARNELANELMIYHMKVNAQDVVRVLCCPKNHTVANFDSFTFSPRLVQVPETPCQVVQMFKTLGMMDKWHIKREMFVRFTLFVERGYRDTPYHNWMHAFSVTHFAYLCIFNYRLVQEKYITLEAMAFFVSCMCHDLDHRGTTNAFQMKTGTVLASLYSSEGSVMERHHLSQTICILSTENCNFLEPLNKTDYAKCLDLIKDMILATDLATHFRILRKQKEMAMKGGYNPEIKEHKYIFLSLLMTAADLSDQTKDWSVVKKVAQCIYSEFFQQGDLEKAMGNKPIEMMDREKVSIPESQIQFLRDVCVPIYSILYKMFPKFPQAMRAIKANMEHWENSKAVFTKYSNSMEVLDSREFNTNIDQILETFSDI